MRFDYSCLLGLALWFSTTSLPSAWATTACRTDSPNLQASRSVWTPVPSQPIPANLQKRILAFVGGLEGHWQGTGSTTACLANAASAVPVRAPERVRLNVTRDGQASFDFQFSIYDTQNNVSTVYHFTLAQHDKTLQLRGEGNLAVSEFYDRGFRFRTQTAMRTGFRRAIGRGSAHTVLSLETVRQLVYQDGALVFYKAVFHNGAMIDYSHWIFQRN